MDKLRLYISEALRRHHPVEEIITKLVSAGHSEEAIRTLTKQAVQERIQELEGQRSESASSSSLSSSRKFAGVVFSFLIRGAIGVIAAWSLYRVVVG